MSANTRKIDILEAASKIVAEKGVFHLTIEAVAKEAGISKGGLLYHYQSKEVLVEKMVEHLASNYRTKMIKQTEADEQDKGKWTRAYLDVTFKKAHENQDMRAGLLAAKAINPNLLSPVREVYSEWQHEIETDGIDPVTATIIRLAADGIWLADLFDINPLDDEDKELVFERLQEWANSEKNTVIAVLLDDAKERPRRSQRQLQRRLKLVTSGQAVGNLEASRSENRHQAVSDLALTNTKGECM